MRSKKPSNRALKTTVSEGGPLPMAASASNTTSSLSGKDKARERKFSPCPLHSDLEAVKHTIYRCSVFRRMSYADKVREAMKHKLCTLCLKDHPTKDCRNDLRCYTCEGNHVKTMHDPSKDKKEDAKRKTVMCTRVCGSPSGRNCSKTVLVELTMDDLPGKALLTYAILDEQANTTLIDDQVADFFGLTFPRQEYSISFASRHSEYSRCGRIVSGLKVRGVLEEEVIALPPALTCSDMVDTTDEIASREVVAACPKIAQYAHKFPQYNAKAGVMLLIGRNCGRAMATSCLNEEEPYVHSSPLGYSVVGCVCPTPKEASSKLRVLHCSLRKDPLSDPLADLSDFKGPQVKYEFSPRPRDEFDTFATFPDDEMAGLSSKDVWFLHQMKDGVTLTPRGKIQLPLPVTSYELPDDSKAVRMRTFKTLEKMKTHDEKLKACLEQMQKDLDAGYVEQVPEDEINSSNLIWYLPVFAVKGKKWRLVYDGSFKYREVSLNSILVSGPNLNNHLRGVILRLREKPIGFGSDLQAMFNNFAVPVEQKDLLRFWWFDGNDPDACVVPYRSTGHNFGLTSSPAVAAFALKYCASQLGGEDSATREYLNSSHYVDDGLGSVDTPEEAIRILTRAGEVLNRFHIKMHKIVSNSPEVEEHFPAEQRAEPVKKLPCDQASTALGVLWDRQLDCSG